MSLYFLHVHDSTGFVEDDEGQELASLDQARGEATAGIRSILAEEELKGSLDLRGRIDIADTFGNILAVVPFSKVVDVRLDQDA